MAPSIKNEKSLFARLGEHAARFFARREARSRAEIKAGYPKTGTGKRQGARLARQQRNWMLDFSASERCIERIKRQARPRKPAPDVGRPVPPHRSGGGLPA